MDDILLRLGKRIRELRIERGFTSQEAFADYLGMHRTFMGHLETGRKDFRLTTLIRVAEALEVPLSELFSNLSSESMGKDKKKVPVGRKEPLVQEAEALERTAKKLRKLASPSKRSDNASIRKGR